MYRQLGINLLEPRSQLLYEITVPLEPAQGAPRPALLARRSEVHDDLNERDRLSG